MAQEPSLLHSQWTCPGPGVGLDTTAPLSTLCPKPEEGGSFLQPCLEARFTGQPSCWVCRRGQGAKALPLEVNMTGIVMVDNMGTMLSPLSLRDCCELGIILPITEEKMGSKPGN